MQIKPAEIEKFLSNPTKKRILAYGPDNGKVVTIIRNLSKDLGEEINIFNNDNITQKANEIEYIAKSTGGLFGQKKVIRIQNATDKATKLLKKLFEEETCPILVEAGELLPSSSLRKLFDKETDTASIACYAPEAKDLAKIADNISRKHNLKLDYDAKADLSIILPQDSLSAENEMEKLCLFAKEDGKITRNHVKELLVDNSSFSMDDVVLAAADGNIEDIAHIFRQFDQKEISIGLLRVAMKHFKKLSEIRAQIDDGQNAATAVASIKPPIFFKIKSRITNQAQKWKAPMIERALGRLTETELLFKKTGYPANILIEHVFVDIAMDFKKVYP